MNFNRELTYENGPTRNKVHTQRFFISILLKNPKKSKNYNRPRAKHKQF